MQTKQADTLFTIPAETSWHFDPSLKPDDNRVDSYTLIQPGASDISKVLKAYSHHPVPAYNIAAIEIVYSESLNRMFYSNMKIMNSRQGNSKYIPEWKSKAEGDEKEYREATYREIEQLSTAYTDPNAPNVGLLPMWHGTSDQVCNFIFSGGYGIFTSNNPQVVTDEGFFGKGIYTAYEAEYSFRAYAKKHGKDAVLVLNWVSYFGIYPVMYEDMPKLQGRMGGFDQSDAHYIQVVPLNPDDSNEINYYPRQLNQVAAYREMVVFGPAQCLPRYRVKLIPSRPSYCFDNTALMTYQMALDFLNIHQYGSVATAFEEAEKAGYPASAIRLHWLYSGASGIIAQNIDACQKIQPPIKETLAALKYKASFRGENDKEVQFVLAWCYQQGFGVEVNHAKAAQYYWIAATQGHRDAQYHLGLCCATGIGVKQDMNQAILYYQQAAAQGHAHASYLLSQCYAFGLGVLPDPIKSAHYEQAAKKGNHPHLAGTVLPVIQSPGPEDNKTILRLEQALEQKTVELQQMESVIVEKEQQLKQQALQLKAHLEQIEQMKQQKMRAEITKQLPSVELVEKQEAEESGSKKLSSSQEKNIIQLSSSQDSIGEGDSPLILAIKNGDYTGAEYLLEQGANVGVRDSDYRTPLHIAVKKIDQRAVSLLLKYQASIDCLDKWGETPLMLAKRKKIKTIEALLTGIGVSNYHAEKLVLRKNIEALTSGEDVISAVSQALAECLLSDLSSSYKETLDKIRKQLLQPEEFLCFEKSTLTETAKMLPKSLFKKKNKDTKENKEQITIEQTSLADEAYRKSLAEADLHENDPLFRKLNGWIAMLTNFQKSLLANKRQPEIIKKIEQQIEAAKQYYLDYRTSICKYQGQIRIELCTGATRTRGLLGFRYLSTGASLRFKRHLHESIETGESIIGKRDNIFGLHAVLQLHDTFYKIRPTAPGIEHAVDSLNKIISGQGSAPTELLIFEKDLTLPVLASKAVKGENCADVLKTNPEWLLILDSFNYSAHLIHTILTRPKDAKPDNFMSVIEKDPSGNAVAIQLIGIDNDLAFGDYLRAYQYQKKQYHCLDLKSLFFCLPQMNQPFDQRFRQAFLKQSPELLMLKWLKELYLQEQSYLSLRGLFTAKQLKEMQIPILFVPGTVQVIYQDLQRIQGLLREHPHLTPHELLNTLYPILARSYAHIREKHSAIDEAIIYLYSNPDVEMMCQDDPTVLDEINRYPVYPQSEEKRKTESVLDACHNFINQIDYANLPDIYLQGYLLEKVGAELSFIETLTIRNCLALNDGRLETLAQKLTQLKSLTLINCSHIDGAGLSAMLCYHPDIEITLEEFSSLSAKNLLNIMQHCSALSFVLGNKTYTMKRNMEELLNLALQGQNHTNLATALLMNGAHFADRNNTSDPALHIAAKEGQAFVVSELLRFGMDADVCNTQGQTALDVAYDAYLASTHPLKKQTFQSILLLLLNHGALQCKEPGAILNTLFNTQITEKNAASLFIFARCRQLLTPMWVSRLIPSDTKILDLSPPYDFKFDHLQLTSELMEAIHEQAPGLEELIITECSGLTKELLTNLLQWNLKTIEMDYGQAESCKISDLGNLRDSCYFQLKVAKIKITTLSLLAKKLDQESLFEFGRLIKNSRDLKKLDLTKCQLNKDNIGLLASCLKKNTSLEYLSFNRNPLGDEGLIILIKALLKNPVLRELHLEETGAGPESAKWIGRLLSEQGTLKRLSLYDNSLGDSGIMAITNGLQERNEKQQPHSLVFLSANKTEMGELGAIALSRAFLFSKTLKELDIGYNPGIGNNGAQGFIQLLELNTTITELKADNIGAEFELSNKLNALVTNNKKLSQKITLDEVAASKLRVGEQRVASVLPLEYQEIKELQLHTEHLHQQLKKNIKSEKSERQRTKKNHKSTGSLSPQSTRFFHSPSHAKQGNVASIKETMKILQERGYCFTVAIGDDPIKKEMTCLKITITTEGVITEDNSNIINTLWNAIVSSLGTFGQEKVEHFDKGLCLSNLASTKRQYLLDLLGEAGSCASSISSEMSKYSHRYGY